MPNVDFDEVPVGRGKRTICANERRGRRKQQDQTTRSWQIRKGARRALYPRRHRQLQRLQHGVKIPGAVDIERHR